MSEEKRVSDAQKRAHRKYMENFVEIKVRMTPEKRSIIQDHARTMGESVTVFINRAIDQAMAQDTVGSPTRPIEVGTVSLPPEANKRAPAASGGHGEDGA